MDSAFECFNVAMRDIGDFTRIYDGVNAALVTLAQEGEKKSLLTEENRATLLAMSVKLSERKASLQDAIQALNGTKEKGLKEDRLDVRDCYAHLIGQKGRKKKAPEDETVSRLKGILSITEKGAPKEEKVLDDAGNVSMDVDATSVQLSQKCPITQKPIKEAYRNIHCRHVFEMKDLVNYIRSKKKNNVKPKCPYLGCVNRKFDEKDFEMDHTFRVATQEF